ncbi:MAG: hypothetical protein WC362_04140 [Methanoregula sp.]
MTVQKPRELRWPAKAGIAVIILLLIGAASLALNIDLLAIVTPVIVGCAIACITLVILAYCLLRWLRIQETLAVQKTADLREVQQGIQAIKQSAESMQKKLDHIETILEKVE